MSTFNLLTQVGYDEEYSDVFGALEDDRNCSFRTMNSHIVTDLGRDSWQTACGKMAVNVFELK